MGTVWCVPEELYHLTERHTVTQSQFTPRGEKRCLSAHLAAGERRKRPLPLEAPPPQLASPRVIRAPSGIRLPSGARGRMRLTEAGSLTEAQRFGEPKQSTSGGGDEKSPVARPSGSRHGARMGVRRCPTLPHGPPCSTIGAVSLSFRVRNVSGRFPDAMAAVTLLTYPTTPPSPGVFPGGRGVGGSYVKNHKVDAIHRYQHAHRPTPKKGGGSVKSSRRLISTSQLHTSRRFHIWPINPVIYWEPHTLKGVGRSHLKAGFPLRCFQRLSIPNVANQPCPWQNNWHTRGPSNPVLSY